MRVLLLALLLACAPAHAQLKMTWGIEPLFNFVCTAMEVDCAAEGIESPLLIVTQMPNSNIVGMYPRGTNVILLDQACLKSMADDDECDGIIAHEITHYIVYYTVGDMLGKCEGEAIAWDIYNVYVRAAGRPRLVRSHWWKEYEDCDNPDLPVLPE